MDKITKSVLAVVAVAFFLIGLNFEPNSETDSPSYSEEKNIVDTSRADVNEPADVLEAFNNAIVNIADQTNPSVVTINTAERVRVQQRSPFSFFFPENGNGEEQEFMRRGLGSGVIASEDGYIITNNHVIQRADEITVTLYEGIEADAEIIGTDPGSDIAVLKIDAQDLEPIIFGDSDQVRVGEMVLAIGSPMTPRFAHSVSQGIVSAKGRTAIGLHQFENYIQTDAAINPGNSGGPLININGELVGINTAIAARAGGVQGIGFAIPSTMVRDVMEALIEDGYVARGYLGITLGAEVDRTMARALELDEPRGFVVGDVVENGPADQAGLQEGDVVVRINGERFQDFFEFRMIIANMSPGTEIELEIFRDRDQRTITAQLGELDAEEVAAGVTPDEREDLREELGFNVEELTDQIRRQLDLGPAVQGVVVNEISEASPAYRQGLRRGDVISEANGNPTANPDEFFGLMNSLIEEGTEVALLRVNRRGNINFVAFEF